MSYKLSKASWPNLPVLLLLDSCPLNLISPRLHYCRASRSEPRRLYDACACVRLLSHLLGTIAPIRLSPKLPSAQEPRPLQTRRSSPRLADRSGTRRAGRVQKGFERSGARSAPRVMDAHIVLRLSGHSHVRRIPRRQVLCTCRRFKQERTSLYKRRNTLPTQSDSVPGP